GYAVATEHLERPRQRRAGLRVEGEPLVLLEQHRVDAVVGKPERRGQPDRPGADDGHRQHGIERGLGRSTHAASPCRHLRWELRSCAHGFIGSLGRKPSTMTLASVRLSPFTSTFSLMKLMVRCILSPLIAP